MTNCDDLTCGDVTHCPVCRAAAKSDRHRAVISSQIAKRAKPAAGPCPLRSAEPVRLQECTTCKGRVRLKVYGCQAYGECTVGTRVAGVKGCCAGCKDRPAANPAGRMVAIPTPPPLDLHPTRTRAVVTVVVGAEAERCFAASGPAMRAYAERVGADLVVLRDYHGPDGWPMGAKFGMARVLDHYNVILSADADVYFPPIAPDLFALTPPDAMGVVDEWPHHKQNRGGATVREMYTTFRRAMGFPVDAFPWYFNAGVMVVPRACRAVIEPPASIWVPHTGHGRHCAEQNLLNARLLHGRYKIRFLPREANWQNWTDHGFKAAPPSAILHWSGEGARRRNRAAEIRAEAARRAPALYAAVPGEWSPPAELFPPGGHSFYADLTHVRQLHAELMTGQYGRALEVGSFHGYSTTAFLDAHRAGRVGEVHLCEPYPTPELRRVIDYYRGTTTNPRIYLHAEKSAAFLSRDSGFDFVYLDGDHDEEPVREELRRVIAANVRCVFSHDVTPAARTVYKVGGGPALVAPALTAAGYDVTVDDAPRPGERTERGLLRAIRRKPEPAPVRLSVIVPTTGRPTLGRALDSITSQLRPGDHLIVEFDDTGDMASTPRTAGMRKATGTHLLFMDDDDEYTAGALAIVRAAVGADPGRVHLFGMTSGAGWSLPNGNEVRPGNVSTQMVCVPNDPKRLGTWGPRRGGDYDFLASCLNHYPEGPVWHPEVIAVWRPSTS